MSDWRKVMPVEVAQLKASPEVLDMSGAARAGFLWLLMAQWTSEDGYLPADEEFLRKASGLREEWTEARNVVVSQFQESEGILSNVVLREIWERSRDARSAMSAGGRKGGSANRAAGKRGAAAGAGGSSHTAAASRTNEWGNTKSSVTREQGAEVESFKKKIEVMAKTQQCELEAFESELKQVLAGPRSANADMEARHALKVIDSVRQELREEKAELLKAETASFDVLSVTRDDAVQLAGVENESGGGVAPESIHGGRVEAPASAQMELLNPTAGFNGFEDEVETLRISAGAGHRRATNRGRAGGMRWRP